MLISRASAVRESDSIDVMNAIKVYGLSAESRILAWKNLIHDLLRVSQTEIQQLDAVNAFFNQLVFISDNRLWGQEDYWATPIEFLGAKGGDCEDFSLAKYFTLRELGIADEKMRLIYVKATSINQFHMVLAYYPEKHAVPLILDNLEGEVKLATERKDLIPIYSFNADHLWLMKERGRGQLAGTASKLSKWTKMRNRYGRGELQKPLMNLSE